MNRGNHIVSLGVHGDEAGTNAFVLTELADAPALADEAQETADYQVGYEAEDAVPRSSAWREYGAPGFAGMAIAGWTAAFGWSKLAELAPLTFPTFAQGLAWFADWSGPVLLICVVWLLVMRNSRREAARFGDAARLLGDESDRLARRLTSVNSELSMAREFIAAQARDLESLGRIATERLSQNAESLQALIHTNSAQIQSISTVSSAALENMEKLRGQLPVIATSARDLTNNIGNAGRTAQAQLQDMIAGFKRMNEFGQASERQVEALRTLVGNSLAELLTQSGEMEVLTARRFASIVERGESFRKELNDHEEQALGAMAERSDALTTAMGQAHAVIETQQAARLAAFIARIDALSQGAEATGAKLASGEDAAIERLQGQLQQIDDDIAMRQEQHLGHVRSVASHGDSMTEQMDALSRRLAEISDFAESTRQQLNGAVFDLTARITEGRAALIGADSEIGELTEASVRLLELIQAGSEHSRGHLPAALGDAELRLGAVEARVQALRQAAGEMAGLGELMNERLAETHGQLLATTGSMEALHAKIGESSDTHGNSLEAIKKSLDAIGEQGGELAAQVESELAQAIERAVSERGGSIATQIEQATLRASDQSREVTIQLRDQLAKVDELTGNLERRVAHAREQAEERIENDFARRVALITESLNSNAIDIARVIDREVSDVSWEAYLKGDRGIFTRRAVSLIDSGEAKSIVQVYESDDSFRGHVNRYIHDFEAMLRQILSTRDGNALGVTLLSSDMGKLYVALAQAIERLRR